MLSPLSPPSLPTAGLGCHCGRGCRCSWRASARRPRIGGLARSRPAQTTRGHRWRGCSSTTCACISAGGSASPWIGELSSFLRTFFCGIAALSRKSSQPLDPGREVAPTHGFPIWDAPPFLPRHHHMTSSTLRGQAASTRPGGHTRARKDCPPSEEIAHRGFCAGRGNCSTPSPLWCATALAHRQRGQRTGAPLLC